MVTGTSDTQHAHTVQTLLAKLDKLKNEGASPLERIRVIQEEGGTILGDPYFSMEEAFDVERRHRSERQKKLVDLRDRLSTLASFWEAAPLAVEIGGAGKKLLGYLTDFVDRAERTERQKEILELSDLWETAPDVSEYFGCVPVTPQRTAEAALKRQEDRLKKAKKELQAEVVAVEEEIEGPLDVKLPENGDVKETARKIVEIDETDVHVQEDGPDLSKEVGEPSDDDRWGPPSYAKDFLVPPPSEEEVRKMDAVLEKEHREFINRVSTAHALQEELKDSMEHLPPVESLEKPTDEDGEAAWNSAKKMEEQIRALDRGDTSSLGRGQKLASKEPIPGDAFWDGENVRKFPIKAEYTTEREDEIPFEGNRLTGEAWAKALSDITEEPFTFRLCAKSSMGNGSIGLSMLWEASKKSLVSRLDVYEENGMYHLGFQFRSAKWENRNVERTLKPAEVRAMHDDPKKWLDETLPLIARNG